MDMKTATAIVLIGALAVIGAKAFSQDAPKGTIIFNPPLTEPAFNCQRLPKANISKRMARHLNRFYPQCGPFEGKEREPVRGPTPRPEPCIKRIEDRGDNIYVPCNHVLTEGQSE